MAIKIGITGGIGSGKSVVAKLLAWMGIPVYQTDAEAKRLMLSDADIRRELTALVGSNAYNEKGLNKALLASYVFGNPEHTRQVNAIVHPKVRHDFRKWAGDNGRMMVALESAILLEAGFRNEVDKVVMVYAPQEVRIERAIRRDSATREQIEKRIRSQMSDESKREAADFVIVNDGETPLIPQVLSLISSLSRNH
ncbi:MAG TPA: dephospho-CoA kinase [Candidatus Bacteroides merdigallinarum]|uniref:Dephospho-CoA kinase n=1 Tax=Candidatus Bacteroides merdigallinarum TaxID=2838473 RepID=A0A9D2E823_9BACE|nr:dephospho-CoA kinase [Candidatus Bacteroides merdigallinarum]